jgi:hypothetical protein
LAETETEKVAKEHTDFSLAVGRRHDIFPVQAIDSIVSAKEERVNPIGSTSRADDILDSLTPTGG